MYSNIHKYCCYIKRGGIIINLTLRHHGGYVTDVPKYHNAGIWSTDLKILRFMFKTYSSSSSLVITSRWFSTSRLWDWSIIVVVTAERPIDWTIYPNELSTFCIMLCFVVIQVMQSRRKCVNISYKFITVNDDWLHIQIIFRETQSWEYFKVVIPNLGAISRVFRPWG